MAAVVTEAWLFFLVGSVHSSPEVLLLLLLQSLAIFWSLVWSSLLLYSFPSSYFRNRDWHELGKWWFMIVCGSLLFINHKLSQTCWQNELFRSDPEFLGAVDPVKVRDAKLIACLQLTFFPTPLKFGEYVMWNGQVILLPKQVPPGNCSSAAVPIIFWCFVSFWADMCSPSALKQTMKRSNVWVFWFMVLFIPISVQGTSSGWTGKHTNIFKVQRLNWLSGLALRVILFRHVTALYLQRVYIDGSDHLVCFTSMSRVVNDMTSNVRPVSHTYNLNILFWKIKENYLTRATTHVRQPVTIQKILCDPIGGNGSQVGKLWSRGRVLRNSGVEHWVLKINSLNKATLKIQ